MALALVQVGLAMGKPPKLTMAALRRLMFLVR